MDDSNRTTVSLIAVVVAVGALLLAFAALFVVRDDDSNGTTPAGGGAAAASDASVVELTLADLKIEPAMPEVGAGPVVIEMTNAGSQVHNISFPSLEKQSADIAPGETARLDLRTLTEGTYEMICTIAGHAAGGMTGMLHVGAPGAVDGGATAEPATTMSADEMDAVMEAVANQFPAETAGHGGEDLAPTVLADGTKQFDLTARDRRLGGRARQDRRGLDLQRRRPRPDDQGRRRRQGPRDRAHERPARVDRPPLPRGPRAERHGRRAAVHAGPDQARRDLHLRVHGPGTCRRHVPLAPRRPDPGAQRHWSARSSSATMPVPRRLAGATRSSRR